MKTQLKLAVMAFLALSAQLTIGYAQGTAFTYQGRLNEGANPASGIYDLRFAIYDAASAGTQQGNLLTNSPTAVTNGLFTVTLDFGNQFPGADRWLEIGVRTNGGGAFTTLNPRQQLTPTPYAITAGSSSNLLGILSPTALAGTYSSPVSFTNTGNSFSGTFSGNGAGLTNLNAWRLGGNAGTTAGTHFIGTTDNQPVEIKVNGQRSLRLEENSGFGAVNLIGGSPQNIIGVGVIGATISGGGTTNDIGFPSINSIYSSFGSVAGGKFNRIAPLSESSTISGGAGNAVGTNSQASTISGGGGGFIGNESEFCSIGGGGGNQIKSQSSLSTIAGGWLNQIGTNSGSGVIGGGFGNAIGDSATSSTIAGGIGNAISTNASSGVIAGGSANTIGLAAGHSTIGGGQNNDIGPLSSHAVVAGGYDNNVGEQTSYTTISGGAENRIEDSSTYATVAGGFGNRIMYSTANGFIGGGGNNTISNSASHVSIVGGQNNSAHAHWSAIGGGYGNRINWGAESSVIPGGKNNVATESYCFAAGNRAWAVHQGSFVWGDSTASDVFSVANNSVTMRASGGYWLFSNSGMSAGVSLYPGGTSWAVISDRNAKKDFASINAVDILEKLSALPITQWRYNWETAETTPHIGPMAQDFKAAFYPGSDDKSITTLEADGVAFAAIQGLNQKLQQKDSEISELKQQLAELKVFVQQLAEKK